MNSQLAIVIMLVVGGVLIWASIKGTDPRTIFKTALGGK